MFKILGTYICWTKIYKMQYLEGSGTPVIYIGRTVLKGYNHFTTAHKEREQMGDRRKDGESNCNSGDGTDQMAQPWRFMMMMMMMLMMIMMIYGLLYLAFTNSVSSYRNSTVTDINA
jgi:hypothetical protein